MTAIPPRAAFLLPGLGAVERGAERALFEVACGLKRRHGWDVELFGRGPDFPHGVTSHAVPCVRRERFERFPRLPGFRSECHYEEATFAAGLRLTSAWDPGRFDVSVTCSYPHLNWLLSRVPEGRRPLRLFVTQNGDWMCRRVNREYKSFDCDGLVAINPEYYERHRETWPAALIPNGVDPVSFPHRVRQVKAAVAGLRVLCVSAMIESKRLDDAIRAVSFIDDAHLTVVGDGPKRDELNALAAELLPGRFGHKPAVPHAEMAAEYERADVFLHCSREEPFGIVLCEAMASGCPVVAHDGPTQRWVLGDAGVLVNCDDVRTLSAAVLRAGRSGETPVLSRRGRSRVEAEFSWDSVVDRYAAFIEERLRTAGRGPNRAVVLEEGVV